MRTISFGSALLATMFAASAAAGADMPVKAPIYKAPIYKAPPPAWSWTGIYFGGNVGYSWGQATTDFSETSTLTSVVTATETGNPPVPLAGNGLVAVLTSTAAGSASANMPGWLGGVQAGYNQQYDWWVLGIEADAQVTGEKDDPTFCGTPGCPVGSAIGTSSTKLPWFATLRGRVGPTFNPNPTSWGPVFLYATGGLAVGEIDSSFTGGLVGGPIGAIDNIDTVRAGWVVGGGGETRIGHTNWTLKVEYLYIDFGDVSGAVSATGGSVVTPFGLNNNDMTHLITTTPAVTGSASTHVTDQILRVGVNYKLY